MAIATARKLAVLVWHLLARDEDDVRSVRRYGIVVTDSYRSDADTWTVFGRDNPGVNQTLQAVVICLGVTPSGGLAIAKSGVKVAKAKKRGRGPG